MKDYSGFIFAAYAFAAVAISGLIAKITLDYRDLKRKLASFQDQDSQP
ncbi:heme exporter protein CcmD [Rhodoblastus acidophilus]|uniref:Heme exporter protein D n=1 Tax=Rhodoblastus acidophilus TaxID=1074 RepID=A0A6N8DJR3_RHOAC|nr:heme exporter protein CcmD [Rhodoblastus acidophilus]MCW2274033.1 heme exporter protein CcmD [Rhodoblastus acidophilus]MTV30607.1 heme exporter protein CcmD [Rhodoblastus acidophilus]